MKEEYRDVKGYEGFYQVSNLGNVISFYSDNPRMLKPQNNGAGYYQVVLCKNKVKKTHRIHVLVAIHFLNHKPCGHKIVVNHINNNSLDNRAVNLEITTQRKNTYTHYSGSSKYKGVGWHKRSKKWQSRILINGKNKHLGMFTDEFKAHLAYQSALYLAL